MTLKEIQYKKDETAELIMELIRKFENETGLMVNRIDQNIVTIITAQNNVGHDTIEDIKLIVRI